MSGLAVQVSSTSYPIIAFVVLATARLWRGARWGEVMALRFIIFGAVIHTLEEGFEAIV